MNPERICYGCFSEKEPGQQICPHCGFDQTEEQPYLALPLGTILNGRYLTGKVLGIGGFGITYLGYDLTLEIKVAIKEYMPSAMATRHADQYSVVLTGRVETDYRYGMERFLDEARILAKLQNTPHIVSVQNYFKENNTAYFVMEYIDGMSLKEYLETRGGKISPGNAMRILQPVMEALEQVHALNLLHRDISPDNIYITAKGESRLLDFGAARFAAGDNNKSVSVILKHGYAPEEQYSSHGNQGPWTDVYAMGATLYRCVTGVLPPDAIERVHGDTLKTPTELGIQLPDCMEKALMKALALKTEDRFADMKTFLSALKGETLAPQRMRARGAEQNAEPRGANKRPRGVQRNEEPQKGIEKLKAFLKKNPVIGWVMAGGQIGILALCIILPIALSSKDKTPIANSQPTQTAQTDTNVISNTGSTEYDLGIYAGKITVPNSYTQQENSWTFVDNQNQRLIALVDYAWLLGGPVYSLSDVENNREAIVDQLVQKMNLQNAQHSILTAGPDTIGNQNAYQILFSATQDNKQMEFIAEAVEGKNDFGCYFLVGCYFSEDTAGKTEVYNALSSFRCTGAIDISYGIVSDSSARVKAICDTSLIKKTNTSTFTLPNGKSGTAMMLYFSDDDALYLEMEEGNAAGNTADECMAYLCQIWKKNKEASLGESGTQTYGGINWKIQNIQHKSDTVIIATADIQGKPYIVGLRSDEKNMENANVLLGNVLSTLRPQ